MCFPFFGELKRFLDGHSRLAEVAALRTRFSAALAACDLEKTLALYREALRLAELLLWQKGAGEAQLEACQALFREYEQLHAQQEEDQRHRFVVVIPVADRPRQLRNCLESLLALCQAYAYGGTEAGRYRAVKVVIAEDSADAAAIAAHAELAREFSAKGLETLHFHQQAQLRTLEGLDGQAREALASVLGPMQPDRFAHKGPSRMRNITYLLLRKMAEEDDRLLFFFLDSDQEFRVLHCNGKGNRELLAVNYFHHLDRIFSSSRVTLLTGKVVGDPPVAPAVMAGNFLEDVIAFLAELRGRPAREACGFHGQEAEAGADAAYHDMADLFGFAPAARPHRYRCTLEGHHDQLAVLDDFARRLDHFFDGEHPTRITCHEFVPVDQSVVPARTVYTGNYVLNAQGLRYFIPFADLRLRMAGPVLGRIARAELGDGFVSANLPLLHKRTLEALGESEFRPGVERQEGRVDLSREFERQFFGDVMLFSVERLTEQGYPERLPPEETILSTVRQTAGRLRRQYHEKQQQIRLRMEKLDELLQDPRAWWNLEPAAGDSLQALRRFLENMQRNFGESSRCYALVDDAQHREERLEGIVDAIAGYQRVRRQWKIALGLA